MASTVSAQANFWINNKPSFVAGMYRLGVEIELLKKWELDQNQDQFINSIAKTDLKAQQERPNLNPFHIEEHTAELCRVKFAKRYAKIKWPQTKRKTPLTSALENEIETIKALIQSCSLSPETKAKALSDRNIVMLHQLFQDVTPQQLQNDTNCLGAFYTNNYEHDKMCGPGEMLDSCLEEVHENAQGAPPADATHSKEEQSNEALGEKLAYLCGVSVETIAKWERNPDKKATISLLCAYQQSGDQKQMLALRQQFENHYREVAAPREDSPLIKKIKQEFEQLQNAILLLKLDEKIRKQTLEDPLRMKVRYDINVRFLERRKKNGLTAFPNPFEIMEAFQEGYIQHYNAQQPKDANVIVKAGPTPSLDLEENVIVKADPTPSLDLEENVIVKADPTPSLDQIAHMRNGASLTGKQILWLTPPLLLGAFLALPHTLLRIAIAVYSVGLCRLLYELRQIESVCQEIEQISDNRTAAATINSRLKQLFKEIYFVQYA